MVNSDQTSLYYERTFPTELQGAYIFLLIAGGHESAGE